MPDQWPKGLPVIDRLAALIPPPRLPPRSILTLITQKD